MGKINLQFAMHALSENEKQTYASICNDRNHSAKDEDEEEREEEEEAAVSVYPTCTHCIGITDGRVKGFTYSTSDVRGDVAQLPICREMFHGHTLVECVCTSPEDIIRLLKDPDSMKRQMQGFVRSICARARENPVCTLQCIPEEAESGGMRRRLECGTSREDGADSRAWVPEMPQCIGLYHAFVRGYNRDTRVHKLFIVVTGGCIKASDEFYNRVLDCHGLASARECAESSEAWWLRRACFRSRCRLLSDCARHFGITIPEVEDTKAAAVATLGGEVTMALATIDTVTQDLMFIPDPIRNMCSSGSGGGGGGRVVVYDSCVGIWQIKNGSLCSMHPSEGFWIFQGIHDRASSGSANAYGVGWSRDPVLAMPTSVIQVSRKPTQEKTLHRKANSKKSKEDYAVVTTSDASFISRVDSTHARQEQREDTYPERGAVYQFLDHSALTFMSTQLGWSRDRGVLELIPIVVAINDHHNKANTISTS